MTAPVLCGNAHQLAAGELGARGLRLLLHHRTEIVAGNAVGKAR